MTFDPDDEPGIVLMHVLVMCLAFIAVGVAAAGIVLHGGL